MIRKMDWRTFYRHHQAVGWDLAINYLRGLDEDEVSGHDPRLWYLTRKILWEAYIFDIPVAQVKIDNLQGLDRVLAGIPAPIIAPGEAVTGPLRPIKTPGIPPPITRQEERIYERVASKIVHGPSPVFVHILLRLNVKETYIRNQISRWGGVIKGKRGLVVNNKILLKATLPTQYLVELVRIPGVLQVTTPSPAETGTVNILYTPKSERFSGEENRTLYTSLEYAQMLDVPLADNNLLPVKKSIPWIPVTAAVIIAVLVLIPRSKN